VQFNSAYVEWKAEHDATLEQLVEAVVSAPDSMGTEFRRRVEDRLFNEQVVIADRRRELRQTLIPEARALSDKALEDGKTLTAKLRQMNPKLDKREEKLKRKRAKLETELDELNENIRRLSVCLTILFIFFKISRLDRARQRVLGRLEETQEQIKDVREKWKSLQKADKAEQDALQKRWQEQTLMLAQYQAESDFLDEEQNRESLAFKRAVRHVVDNLKEGIRYPSVEIESELDKMVDLNVQTDKYESALRSVVEILALLDGVGEGLKRFGQSVQGLVEEQSMHGAYLPKLNVSIPDEVLVFNRQWEGLADLVRDDVTLRGRPVEFVGAVQPVIDEGLSEKAIRHTFDQLGRALKSATSHWKG